MKKTFRTWIGKLALLVGLVCTGMVLQSCSRDDGGGGDDGDGCSASRLYDTCRVAKSFNALKGAELYDILGSTIVDQGVNFAVYAKNATRVEVLIFDEKDLFYPGCTF